MHRTTMKVLARLDPSIKGESLAQTGLDRRSERRRRKALLVAFGLIALTLIEAYFAYHSDDSNHGASTHQAARR